MSIVKIPSGDSWRNGGGEPITAFNVRLLPHSYALFGVEK